MSCLLIISYKVTLPESLLSITGKVLHHVKLKETNRLFLEEQCWFFLLLDMFSQITMMIVENAGKYENWWLRWAITYFNRAQSCDLIEQSHLILPLSPSDYSYLMDSMYKSSRGIYIACRKPKVFKDLYWSSALNSFWQHCTAGNTHPKKTKIWHNASNKPFHYYACLPSWQNLNTFIRIA